ncbi:lysylphosphatidylglycerol synthase transmembrane domain-containing protein [Aquirufa sp. HETE-83D]|uniref:Lysylphosphatidylglycerol synthase transmembrane domain-containing protein n=1 Tax=Aquirufa esocilacus TaxID=3096513 RepID=A0ABW6DJ98_9BACT
MLKSILKYLISSLLALVLLSWAFSTSHLHWRDLLLTFFKADYNWVTVSIVIAIISHLLRALRWEQLLGAMKYQPGTVRTFSAVLIGYFANFLVPRLGEVSRCGSLKKTADIPFEESFGTVITERIVDLLSLVVLVGITFIFEWKPLQESLFPTLHLPSGTLIITASVLGLLGLGILWKFKDFLQKVGKESKVGKMILGWVAGIGSIRHLDQPGKFIGYSAGIWLCYYLSTYTLFLAFPMSENLGMSAALTVLVMGTFGMATPTQGGIGAYHSLVASAFVFYSLAYKDGFMLATFFHGTQMITLLLLGGISFILTLFLPKINSRVDQN